MKNGYRMLKWARLLIHVIDLMGKGSLTRLKYLKFEFNLIKILETRIQSSFFFISSKLDRFENS